MDRGIDAKGPAGARDLFVPLEISLDRSWRGQSRVEINGHAQALSALEDHPIFLFVQKAPHGMTMDHRADEFQILDTALELIGSDLGRCGRQRRETGEAVRMCLNRRSKAVIRVLCHWDGLIGREALRARRVEG